MIKQASTNSQNFNKYLSKKGLNKSSKRELVLKAFFKSERQLSINELYNIVKKDHPEIGHTTVYRTLKLILDSGLAEKVNFNDDTKSFEYKVGCRYDAYMICNQCKTIQNIYDKNIEQNCYDVENKYGFKVQTQRFQFFGLCKDCSEVEAKEQLT